MKRLFFGLLIAGIAFGGSAFTNAHTVKSVNGNKSITAQVLGLNSSGLYFQANAGGTCTGTASFLCNYTVNQPNSIPNKSTYTPAEIDDYVAAGWLTAASTVNTRYVAP